MNQWEMELDHTLMWFGSWPSPGTLEPDLQTETEDIEDCKDAMPGPWCDPKCRIQHNTDSHAITYAIVIFIFFSIIPT